jgi:hypothetical protein
LELFSLERKSHLLPGGFFVCLTFHHGDTRVTEKIISFKMLRIKHAKKLRRGERMTSAALRESDARGATDEAKAESLLRP